MPASLFFRQIEQLPERVYQSGKIIIEENFPSRGIFFLTQGVAEILKADGVLAEVKQPGAMFGEMSHLLTVLPTATVRAKTEVRVRVCECPTSFLTKNPEATLFIANNLAQRLDSLNQYVANMKKELSGRAASGGFLSEIEDLLTDASPR